MKGKMDEEKRICEEAFAYDSEDVKLERAKEYVLEERFQDAIFELEDDLGLISESKEVSDLYHEADLKCALKEAGVPYSGQGYDPAAAEKALKETDRGYQVCNPLVIGALGRAYLMQGKVDEAVETLEKAVKADKVMEGFASQVVNLAVSDKVIGEDSTVSVVVKESLRNLDSLGAAYKAKGDEERSEEIATEIIKRSMLGAQATDIAGYEG